MQGDSMIGTLLAIRPGQSVVYFVGFLGGHEKAAALALQLAMQGRLHLTQRRLGLPTKDGTVDWRTGIGPGFEYIATGALREEKWFDPIRP